MQILTLPGLVDAHVHLRDPGATHKEDIVSGMTAALAGGFVAVFDMPNNKPPITSLKAWRAKQAHFCQNALIDYGLFVGYEGGDPTWLTDVADEAVGLKLYLDETFGDLTLSGDALRAVFEAWPNDRVIAIHAEEPTICMALALAQEIGQRIHVCHIPTPDALRFVADAKEAGQPVTCEITPHHLFLSTDDLPRLGALGLMKPELVSLADVRRNWELLGYVDAVASDHAPHTLEEKRSPAPPPGVPGLETTLLLLLHAVDQGRLTFQRLVELLSTGPLGVYGLEPIEAQVEVAWTEPYPLPGEGYRSRCGWSPFVDKLGQGRVERVTLRGEVVYEQGNVSAPPGSGRVVCRA